MDILRPNRQQVSKRGLPEADGNSNFYCAIGQTPFHWEGLPHICHFFYTGRMFWSQIVHQKTTKTPKYYKNTPEKWRFLQLIWKASHLTENVYTGTTWGACDKYEFCSKMRIFNGVLWPNVWPHEEWKQRIKTSLDSIPVSIWMVTRTTHRQVRLSTTQQELQRKWENETSEN